mmetsp:Transcript_19771/g.17475  ORF Transcript_19771/g.17475 Transcript_19771/m.17475 type:complete len:89 (+) Transcript_19771:258-524(+)
MDKEDPYQNPFKGTAIQSTSYEADISVGIHEAMEESKNSPPRESIPGMKTFLQFKLNDGKVLHASINLESTTVIELKEKMFKKELEEK